MAVATDPQRNTTHTRPSASLCATGNERSGEGGDCARGVDQALVHEQGARPLLRMLLRGAARVRVALRLLQLLEFLALRVLVRERKQI